MPHWHELWDAYRWKVPRLRDPAQARRLLKPWEAHPLRDFRGQPIALTGYLLRNLFEAGKGARWQALKALPGILRHPLEVWQVWNEEHHEWRFRYLAPVEVVGRALMAVVVINPSNGALEALNLIPRENWSSANSQRAGILRFRNYPLKK